MLIDEGGNPIQYNRMVSGLDAEEVKRIEAYLQGAVYAWCNCKGKEGFRFATFAGGDNYFWEGTGLEQLYEKQSGSPQECFDRAAREGGILLRRMLSKDKRTFCVMCINGTYVYSWTGQEKGN